MQKSSHCEKVCKPWQFYLQRGFCIARPWGSHAEYNPSRGVRSVEPPSTCGYLYSLNWFSVRLAEVTSHRACNSADDPLTPSPFWGPTLSRFCPCSTQPHCLVSILFSSILPQRTSESSVWRAIWVFPSSNPQWIRPRTPWPERGRWQTALFLLMWQSTSGFCHGHWPWASPPLPEMAFQTLTAPKSPGVPRLSI